MLAVFDPQPFLFPATLLYSSVFCLIFVDFIDNFAPQNTEHFCVKCKIKTAFLQLHSAVTVQFFSFSSLLLLLLFISPSSLFVSFFSSFCFVFSISFYFFLFVLSSTSFWFVFPYLLLLLLIRLLPFLLLLLLLLLIHLLLLLLLLRLLRLLLLLLLFLLLLLVLILLLPLQPLVDLSLSQNRPPLFCVLLFAPQFPHAIFFRSSSTHSSQLNLGFPTRRRLPSGFKDSKLSAKIHFLHSKEVFSPPQSSCFCHFSCVIYLG